MEKYVRSYGNCLFYKKAGFLICLLQESMHDTNLVESYTTYTSARNSLRLILDLFVNSFIPLPLYT